MKEDQMHGITMFSDGVPSIQVIGPTVEATLALMDGMVRQMTMTADLNALLVRGSLSPNEKDGQE